MEGLGSKTKTNKQICKKHFLIQRSYKISFMCEFLLLGSYPTQNNSF